MKPTRLVAALLFALAMPVIADQTPQTLPYSQDWSTTGALLTTNNTWTSVPGVEGYLGDDAATSAAPYSGGDPQTVLTFFGALNVIVNQSNPTITNGGVAEFDGIADPVVALQGSGTADAPYLMFTLNTTGNTSIQVAYDLRDIDSSADNSIQPIALQYRVGNTGGFTNVAAAYVADASVGPSLTASTHVAVTLPAACDNQPLIQIRMITTNASGSDEWIGIDNVSVTGTTPVNLQGFAAE